MLAVDAVCLADENELLPTFAEIFPWPAIAVDEAGVVVYVNALMRDRGIACPDPGTISLAEWMPEYFAVLRGRKPWRIEQSATICRETAAGAVQERLWLRKVPGGSCLVIMKCTPEREPDVANAQTARLASLGFMVAGVCHEISNPLSAIHSMVQILRSERRVSREILDKGLANIQVNVKRLIDVARKLTNFSRVGDEERMPLQLDRVVEETILLARQHPALGSTLIDFRPEPRAMVLGRAGELQQVFYNIILNAIQALAGSGHIRACVSCGADDVEVAICDDGPGIRQADLGRIFDPFFTTKPSGEGTGLGLAISNEIVVEHGGTIRAENNASRGATIYVRLPLHRGVSS